MIPSAGLLTLEAANLFCGRNTESHHLRLLDVRLPGMDEQYVDHRPGGAPVGIEVDVQLNKLQCDFTLAGWTPHVAELVDAWSTNQQQFMFYGALRDRVMTNVVQAAATMTGRLGRADMQSYRRGAENAWAYSIRAIIYYQLIVGDETVYEWDFFTNTLTVAGQ